ncbi:MAG: DNA adenine methylase, partial [Terracidiphilus sp.]
MKPTFNGGSVRDTDIAPLLKWPGGKRRLVKILLPLIPATFGTYYEPFVGSGALFFALKPTEAFLSDKNRDLITTYRQVRANPNAVINYLRRWKNNSSTYYSIRSRKPENNTVKAARLIYLSTLSFNGIHRVNLAGQFNVPYGRKKHLQPCHVPRLRRVSAALKNARLECEDFEDAVRNATKGDFVYMDPPYTVTHSNNGFVKYNAKIFTWSDKERLARVAR